MEEGQGIVKGNYWKNKKKEKLAQNNLVELKYHKKLLLACLKSIKKLKERWPSG